MRYSGQGERVLMSVKTALNIKYAGELVVMN